MTAGPKWPFSNWKLDDYQLRLSGTQRSVFTGKIQVSTRSQDDWAYLTFDEKGLGLEESCGKHAWRLYYDAAATLSQSDHDGYA